MTTGSQLDKNKRDISGDCLSSPSTPRRDNEHKMRADMANDAAGNARGLRREAQVRAKDNSYVMGGESMKWDHRPDGTGTPDTSV